jgi:hypothetical protein
MAFLWVNRWMRMGKTPAASPNRNKGLRKVKPIYPKEITNPNIQISNKIQESISNTSRLSLRVSLPSGIYL